MQVASVLLLALVLLLTSCVDRRVITVLSPTPESLALPSPQPSGDVVCWPRTGLGEQCLRRL